MSIREEVSQIDGVADIAVSAATGKLEVSTTGDVTDAAVIAAVAEAGYEAVRAS